ncbi:LuxR C-terminal-related transcriptional regulator, partial [Streptomyces shenzhenensis]|uniref:LuxR C-terminal-related transcriptional regulator n=1 Tax=Streptomyces shenzhenensis TaxID=943815 RepID=UPI0036BBE61D
IAAQLHLAEGTVRNYLSNAMRKTQTQTRHEATRYARKMARAVKALGVGRFDLIYGNQSISARLRAVELYGTKVLPMVREILAS